MQVPGGAHVAQATQQQHAPRALHAAAEGADEVDAVDQPKSVSVETVPCKLDGVRVADELQVNAVRVPGAEGLPGGAGEGELQALTGIAVAAMLAGAM